METQDLENVLEEREQKNKKSLVLRSILNDFGKGYVNLKESCFEIIAKEIKKDPTTAIAVAIGFPMLYTVWTVLGIPTTVIYHYTQERKKQKT